jgi:hypothetical protein
MGEKRKTATAPPWVLEEMRFYFGESERALGARGRGTPLTSYGGVTDPEATVTNRRYGTTLNPRGDVAREREIHRALCQLSALHAQALHLYHEPRRWPRETWAGYGSMIGVALLTHAARAAHPRDGLLHWLGSAAARKDKTLLTAILREANGILADAYAAYLKARGPRRPRTSTAAEVAIIFLDVWAEKVPA